MAKATFETAPCFRVLVVVAVLAWELGHDFAAPFLKPWWFESSLEWVVSKCSNCYYVRTAAAECLDLVYLKVKVLAC